MNLQNLGWHTDFQTALENLNDSDLVPGRVSCEHRGVYLIYSTYGDLKAKTSGKMKHNATSRAHLPAVGDWVALQVHHHEQTATIHAVLPRRSAISRQGSSSIPDEQIIAANINTVFVVTALDGEFHPRRVERYLTMVWNSGANPVVILNKTDVCDTVDQHIQDLTAIAPGIAIHAISAVEKWDLENLTPYIGTGQTVALAGSSGVGKSTLINSLLGENRQKVAAVRERDNLGRHTTTHRELIALPTGGLIIDTPGMRSLQMWGEETTQGFQDIENLITQCRFHDCTHTNEPDCTIRSAIQTNQLEQGRWASYLSIQRELARTERKMQQKARIQEQQGRKKFKKASRRQDKMQIKKSYFEENM